MGDGERRGRRQAPTGATRGAEPPGEAGPSLLGRGVYPVPVTGPARYVMAVTAAGMLLGGQVFALPDDPVESERTLELVWQMLDVADPPREGERRPIMALVR